MAIESSSWHSSVGNQGDNDYGLEAIAMCDDCRYGVAFHRLAAVYFDLGVGSSPSFSGRNVDRGASGAYGFTFEHGGTQFFVGRPRNTGSCSAGGLYVFDSIDMEVSDPVQCLEAPDPHTAFNSPDGGRYLRHASLNGGTPYVWTMTGTQVGIWEVVGAGSDTRLEFVRHLSEMWAFGRGNAYHGFDVDLDERIGVSFDRHGFVTWQIDDLSDPTRIAVSDIDDVYGNVIALSYPIAFTSGGGRNSGRTWNVSDPSAPELLEPGFWSTTESWNQHECDLGADRLASGRLLSLVG
ncbi:MAG TPA: hypothetical protein RMH99_13010 [Sandaracinaceae bacterium LLY-WYZ-13_1]|nr:hypothetical protein [Sandaracinaceae bacterium LLY-WYZ-13_1]